MALSILDDDIFGALSAFLLNVLPTIGRDNIRQGQQNRVPMPAGANFIIMIPTDRVNLSTARHSYIPASNERDTARSVRIGCALNFYGDQSADNAQIFSNLFWDSYGCDFLASYNVQPLWCDDGRQMPLIDSEKQYNSRWLVNALMQASPSVSTTQDFADTLAATVLGV